MDLSEKQSKIEIFVQAKSTAALKSPHYTHFSGLNMFTACFGQKESIPQKKNKLVSEKWDEKNNMLGCSSVS